MNNDRNAEVLAEIVTQMRAWGRSLGFADIGVCDVDLDTAGVALRQWLAAGYQGEMHWMERHGEKRYRPAHLHPGTVRIITVRLDYLPQSQEACWEQLGKPTRAYLSRYALGRDYHKLTRQRLQRLAQRLTEAIGPFGYRVFTDSAPVMEKPLAQKAGLGWIGKHTNLIDKDSGSWFFLGEIYTDLPLPISSPASNHCGSCRACLDICPTAAIVAPYQLDARRCISYLTIEHSGPIPEALRPAFGNRIYGCDDCQLICPWNKFARLTREADFAPRHGLDDPDLVDLMGWDEATFLERMAGSAVRRIGHARWQRNLAVALGNAPGPDRRIIACLRKQRATATPLVREHIDWALGRQLAARPDKAPRP